MMVFLKPEQLHMFVGERVCSCSIKKSLMGLFDAVLVFKNFVQCDLFLFAVLS